VKDSVTARLAGRLGLPVPAKPGAWVWESNG
jgi:hypothetical protein